MKAIRKLTRSPVATFVLFALAAVLLLGGSVGGARAALNAESNDYTAGVEMYDIGVTLMEKCENDTAFRAVSWRNYVRNSDYVWDESSSDLLSGMVAPGEKLQIGRKYSEELAVLNSGAIDTYVRVKVYAYWEGQNEQGVTIKRTDLDPSLIHIEFDADNGNGWVTDAQAPSDGGERTVLYYTPLLTSGSMTPSFTKSVSVDTHILYLVHQTVEGNKIISHYDYDGQSVCLEVEADAVQNHNAQSAIGSVWGRRVTANGSSVNLS